MGKRRTLEELRKQSYKLQPNLEILKEFPGSRQAPRRILVRCKVCNQEYTKAADKLTNGCPFCLHVKVAKGFNDIATTAPWMVPFLKDKEDATRYASKSNKRIWFKCPSCGKEKMCIIGTVCVDGFSCSNCSDKMSKPNKFVRSLLVQLPVENVQYEYSSDWTDGKRYDAYFEYQSKRYVIEMDGEQHYKDSEWGKACSQKSNDLLKSMMAFRNGVEIIRIYSPYNKYDQWISAFLHSAMGDLLASVDIDWSQCIKYAESNIMYEICKEYKNGNRIIEISRKLGISRSAVRAYVTTGSRIGLCEYPMKRKRISVKHSPYKKVCNDYQHIENYDLAEKDSFKNWRCHHRLATHDENGHLRDKAVSIDELKKQGLYYNRPAGELIFLTAKDYGTLYSHFIKSRKHTIDVRKQMSEARRGSKWWNDGKSEVHTKQCPPGFVAGRLPHSESQKMKNSIDKKGSQWWTNGIEDRFCKECPDGFYKGRTKYRRKEGP